MPLYDYQCRNCSEVTEVRHGFREAYQGTCPACGGSDLARVFNAAGIVFKGSGFYLTDSRKQASDAAAASAKSSSAKSDAPKSDSSTSTPSESSSATPATAAAPATPAAPASDAGSKKSDASAA